MTTLCAWFTQTAAASSMDLTQLVISSFTGAITALIFFAFLGRRPSAAKEPPAQLRRQRSSRDQMVERQISTASAPPLLQRGDSSGDSFRDDVQMSIGRHTEDATLRLPNAYLMQRGRAAHPRQIGNKYGPALTEVVRIALTGGPCAGKSSALDHLTRAATEEGFDVLTAPEVATLYFNASYQLPTPSAHNFSQNLFTFQKNILKLQLQMERCFTDLAARTDRPTIVVFDRGLLDCKAYMSADDWTLGVNELDHELRGPGRVEGSVTEDHLRARYDGVIHLVTAADGVPEHYKYGVVEDDSGGQVYRRETPAEAIEIDRKLQTAWKGHTNHIIVQNSAEGGFESKLLTATEAVLSIARATHPHQWEVAQERHSQAVRLSSAYAGESGGSCSSLSEGSSYPPSPHTKKSA